MTDGSGFLGRWSRRKQAAARPAETPAEAPDDAALPKLPALDSLGAASDYAAFLQRGVPAALQQQALQRAWTSDAGIAAFRGMAEYDWDFNAAGYGRLRAADDVAQLLRAVLSLETPPSDPACTEATDAVEPVVVRRTVAAEPVASAPPAEPPNTAAAAPAVQRHGTAKPV